MAIRDIYKRTASPRKMFLKLTLAITVLVHGDFTGRTDMRSVNIRKSRSSLFVLPIILKIILYIALTLESLVRNTEKNKKRDGKLIKTQISCP